MGAPKQKWRAEEEAALRAGVLKHGAGKWRTILKDPEFSGVLHLRSNVDLKDKWRNMSVMANGWGSRERGRTAMKRSHQHPKHDENSMALTTVDDPDDELVDAKPLAISNETLRTTGNNKTATRLENLIMEAITNLKEPTGSNRTAIALYIEDQYWSPPNFKKILSAKLKALTASRKLIKVKRKYRIAPSFPEERSSRMLLLESRVREKVERDDFKPLTKSQIDAELAKIRNMTAQEAAAAAAQAVAEAEAAIAEAEEAARDAENAEADAEAAQAFAEAAMMALKNRNAAKLREFDKSLKSILP
uniref:Histone H1 n=1 Tax=Anthurium amnicola TaxID=1678845 RepID=A0A1D1YW94_9ARAE